MELKVQRFRISIYKIQVSGVRIEESETSVDQNLNTDT